MENKDNKVILLKETETKFLREELEDLIIEANMLLQNKDFKNIENLIKNASKIVQKVSSVQNRLDKFDEDLSDMVLALQGVINRLQESANVADELKEQHKKIKEDIEKVVESYFLTLKAELKQKTGFYAKKAVKEMKNELDKELKDFQEEIEKGIQKARKSFGFFEQEEIIGILKEIDLRRKKANAAFYTAIFLFIASAAITGLTYFNVQKILKYTQYNAYTLQQITQNK